MLSSEKSKYDKWSNGFRFRITAYNEVMNRLKTKREEVTKKLLDFDMCNKYFCVIKDMLLIQREDIGNPLTNSDLTTYRIKKLFGIAIGRKKK